MNKTFALLFLPLLLCQCTGRNSGAKGEIDTIATPDSTTVADTIPSGAKKLMVAYPDKVVAYQDGNLVMTNGYHIVYDDSIEKDYITMLDNSDPQDMFAMEYNTRNGESPEYLADAGRSRCEELFKVMYGKTENEARSNLVTVEWFGQRVPFTSVNGAADSLRLVAKALGCMPNYEKYLKKASTFYWRKVRGAKRQSAHSYGIAIDINIDYSNYWLWSNNNASETDSIKYENRIPLAIVEVFEHYGFIWSGRWYHYDTMHFEFRPELLK